MTGPFFKAHDQRPEAPYQGKGCAHCPMRPEVTASESSSASRALAATALRQYVVRWPSRLKKRLKSPVTRHMLLAVGIWWDWGGFIEMLWGVGPILGLFLVVRCF